MLLKVTFGSADSPEVNLGPTAQAARRSPAERAMRALVVDDQASARMLLSSIPRADLGCTVVEAAQGAEALALLERQPFDVMILDILMPVMDGIATLEAVRRHQTHGALPVIVLSAVRDEARVRRLVQLGITAYLVKPLRPLDVADRLRHLVARVERTTAVPRPYLPDPRTAELRPQLIAATEQVFGMMLGLEVVAIGQGTTAHAGDDVVSVRLEFERAEDADLTFTVVAPRAITERMTAQYLQGGDVVADADVSATLRELASVIGSRLQSTLQQRGDRVTLHAPVVTRVGRVSDDDLEQTGICVAFASATQDLRFTTQLRAVPAGRSHDSQLQAEPVPRNLKMDMSALPPPVDTEVLDMLASLQEPGEPDLLAELVSLFLRDTPERLQDLARHPLEAAPVARVAHAVKGSAGNLGATHLQELASQLEQAGHQAQGSEQLATLAAAVCEEFSRVETYLQRVLALRSDTGSTTH